MNSKHPSPTIKPPIVKDDVIFDANATALGGCKIIKAIKIIPVAIKNTIRTIT